MLHVWTTAQYTFPLPPGHRFPAEKYAMIRDRILAEGIIDASSLHLPSRVSREDLLRVHTERYVDAVAKGGLTPAEQRLIGLPWSEGLAERSLRATARRIKRAAIVDLDVHQGNGTHALVSGDTTVYAFSMHGRKNYPFRKIAGTLDIGM